MGMGLPDFAAIGGLTGLGAAAGIGGFGALASHMTNLQDMHVREVSVRFAVSPCTLNACRS